MSVPFWKHAEHRIPTLGLYRRILKTVLQLPVSCVNMPGKRRVPIQGKGLGPPGAITRQLLLDAEKVYMQLLAAKNGDMTIRNELRDMVQGKSGRIKEVLDHCACPNANPFSILLKLNHLVNWEPGTTQRERYLRLKRAQELVWDIRPSSSIKKDPHPYYKITLKPELFEFPPDRDYYPPAKYPNQMKNQRGKFKNFGGVFLTEVETSEGSRFPRIRGGTQPTWLSMMLKNRVNNTVKRVNEWKNLEELKQMMILEERFLKQLGVEDSGYVEVIDKRLTQVKDEHKNRKLDGNAADDSQLEELSE
ncbi:hypothetical protein BGZ94_003819 [Podila epigama]|nr:hypothetical protein BGZ94_003819 [Podila epigama]